MESYKQWNFKILTSIRLSFALNSGIKSFDHFKSSKIFNDAYKCIKIKKNQRKVTMFWDIAYKNAYYLL